MTSAAYRQASNDRPDCWAVDAENTLLWKMNRQRLEFEAMRDALLAFSGELSAQIGGAPFQDIESQRRSLYRLIDRQYMPRLLLTFDVADPDATLPKRATTTVPQQALYLLNSRFVNRRSQQIVEQLDKALGRSDVEARVEHLYRQICGRDPSNDEFALATEFLQVAFSDPPDVATIGGEAASWQYGTGKYEDKTNRVSGFVALTFFDGRHLQRQAESYDRGGAYFMSNGGRPGRNRQYSLIRRWTATEAGMYVIKGTLAVNQNDGDGDGIQAWVVSDRQGELGNYEARLGKTRVRIVRVQVEKGEQLDFIVDGHKSNRNDDFTWPIEVWRARESDNGDGGLIGIRGWKAEVGFEDAVPSWLAPMGPWEQYVQALLISNEVMFID